MYLICCIFVRLCYGYLDICVDFVVRESVDYVLRYKFIVEIRGVFWVLLM